MVNRAAVIRAVSTHAIRDGGPTTFAPSHHPNHHGRALHDIKSREVVWLLVGDDVHGSGAAGSVFTSSISSWEVDSTSSGLGVPE
jgi:hypothetical protein